MSLIFSGVGLNLLPTLRLINEKNKHSELQLLFTLHKAAAAAAAHSDWGVIDAERSSSKLGSWVIDYIQ